MHTQVEQDDGEVLVNQSLQSFLPLLSAHQVLPQLLQDGFKGW
jgi:hypothetical protein